MTRAWYVGIRLSAPADHGYGFAGFAAYRFDCAQTESMLDDVMDKLRADPPRVEQIANVTYPAAAVGSSTADQDSARRAAARLEDEARYTEVRNRILGFTPVSPPNDGALVDPSPSFAIPPVDESDGTYCADWLSVFTIDDDGNPTYRRHEPMLKYVEFNLTVAPDGPSAPPPQVPAVAASKARRVVDWIRSFVRRR